MDQEGKVVFIVGLIGVAIAVTSAMTNLATEYELSIYAATPLTFWIGVASTGIAGIVGGILLPKQQERIASAAVSIIALTLVLLLPVLRGYYFYGQADALLHLAWVNDLAAGRDLFNNLLYPGFHTFVVIVARITSIPPRLALMGIMPVFYLLFVSALPLLAREFYPTQPPRLTPVAILFGLLTTPIISVRIPNIQPLPTVAGMFLVPMVVWVGIRMDQAQKLQRQSFLIASIAMLTALMFYHPQQALSVVMLFGVYLLIPLGSISKNIRRLSRSPLPTATLIGGGVLMFWLSTRTGFRGALLKLIHGFQRAGGGAVAVPGTSFQEIGGSIAGLFIRVLLIPTVIGLAAVVAAVAAVWGIYRNSPEGGEGVHHFKIDDRRLLRYLFGLVPILLLGAVTFVAVDLAQSLRYLALAVALGTPVGAMLLWRVWNRSDRRRVTVAVVLILLVGTVAATPTALRSPIVYQATPQVTEAQIVGYNWMFAHRDNAPVAAIDTDVGRQLRVANSYQKVTQQSQGQDVVAKMNGSRAPGYVPSHFADHNLTNISSQTRILMSTEFAKTQHTKLYDGLIFSKRDFAYLNHTSGISVVYTNGDTKVRRVD